MNLNGRTSGRFEIFFIAKDVLCLSVFLYGPVQWLNPSGFRDSSKFAMPQAPSSL